MNATRFPALSQARWDWVIEKGTCFFGRTDLCGYWEARQRAWGWINPAATTAWTLGTDADFLSACALHISELEEAYDKESSKDVFRPSKSLPRVVLGKRGQGLQIIRKIYRQLPTAGASRVRQFQALWRKAKVQVTEDQEPGETKVDE